LSGAGWLPRISISIAVELASQRSLASQQRLATVQPRLDNASRNISSS